MDNEDIKCRPAVLIFPGGGYFFCSAREGEPVAAEYLAAGFNAFVLRYSVGKEFCFDDSFNDAKDAFTYIVENSENLNTDKNKIAVCGFSAGGHLAAALSTVNELKPCATILGYPCILSSISDILAFPVPSVNEYVNNDTPPAFITAACNDSLVPVENSLAYASALDKFNIPFELHIFSDGPHGFSVAKPHTAGESKSQYSLVISQWVDMSIDFLNKIFDISVNGQAKF